ncbi:radical SAM/SPASM domain-containing protein [Clostridium sp. BL-8]|uniref:radical SAM/SPASM domain-containing protein n=1 Tax=Clostridium sp. BL-8 TaxID=349938 RepID=UPI00098C500E|nr:radical SAM/SPASM domain-containing protein [Clostridium sp. BL-8]OOM79960.1 coenzyme PQQ synthesis protein E [Clostridium sp. BL-8]
MENDTNKEMLNSKNEYLDYVRQVAKLYDHVIIYGAGKIAKPLYKLLNEENIIVSAFCVTDKSINKTQEFGTQIIQIDEMNFEKSKTLVLIGVRKKWSKEVISVLKEYGYDNYIDVPKYVEYFDKKIIDKRSRPVLEITTRIGCSVNCRYCPQDILCKNYFDNKKSTVNMSFDTFKTCIDKTPDNLMVDFSGFSEPFLNPECLKMILYAAEKGRYISLYTTLVGMTKEIFHKIKKIPFLEVVLHTPDEEEYANIPLTEEYFEVLDLIIDTKKNDGSMFIDSANCQSKPHQKVLQHTNGKIRIFSELIDRAGNLADENLARKSNVKGLIYCNRAHGLNHNVLLPDGSVVLCCMDFGMQHVIGNLLDESYENIINGKNINFVKNEMRKEQGESILCRNCTSAIKV